jgi:hypothetical protein
MSFTQHSLFGDDQPDLFGAAPAAQPAYQVKPEHIRNRFIEFMETMTGAETWPYDADDRERFLTRTWPYLWAKFPDPAEAAEWRAKMLAEAARLDAASPPPASSLSA